jgi:hypothetical protein
MVWLVTMRALFLSNAGCLEEGHFTLIYQSSLSPRNHRALPCCAVLCAGLCSAAPRYFALPCLENLLEAPNGSFADIYAQQSSALETYIAAQPFQVGSAVTVADAGYPDVPRGAWFVRCSLQRDPEGPSQPHVNPGTQSMSRL